MRRISTIFRTGSLLGFLALSSCATIPEEISRLKYLSPTKIEYLNGDMTEAVDYNKDRRIDIIVKMDVRGGPFLECKRVPNFNKVDCKMVVDFGMRSYKPGQDGFKVLEIDFLNGVGNFIENKGEMGA